MKKKAKGHKTSHQSKKTSRTPLTRKKSMKDKRVEKKSLFSPKPFYPVPVAPLPSFRPEERHDFHDLPFSYGETKLVLLVRDPYWAYSYWDFSGETWNEVQGKLAADSTLKPMIRVHDLDSKRSFDLLVSLEARNWYLHLGIPDHRYVAELGMGDGRSRFYLIVRSNEVRTPRDSPSVVVDSEWSDRDLDEIYRLSGGGRPGLSSPGSVFIPRQA